MIKIASYGGPGLTQRLQETLKDYVQLEDITYTPTTDTVKVIHYIKKALHFLKGIKGKSVVSIYAYPSMWRFIVLAKLAGKKVIVHWIGTDVYLLKQNPKKYLIKKGDVNLAHSESLQKELIEFDINTDILTILPQGIDLSMGSMPKDHAVLFYIPEGREEFYNYKWITALINHFPDLPFHIVANGKKEMFPQSNAIVHGKISLQQMEKLYNEISIVVRFPEHDSLSISIMEAMFKAKIIIYRYEQECTIRAKTLEEFISRMQEQISQPPCAVLEAREYALNHFTEEIVRKQFQLIADKYML